jgi:hypothetical protein
VHPRLGRYECGHRHTNGMKIAAQSLLKACQGRRTSDCPTHVLEMLVAQSFSTLAPCWSHLPPHPSLGYSVVVALSDADPTEQRQSASAGASMATVCVSPCAPGDANTRRS